MQTLFLLLKPAPSNPQRQLKLHAVSFEEVVPHSPQQSHQLLQLCQGRSQRMEPSRPHSAAWLLGPPHAGTRVIPPRTLYFLSDYAYCNQLMLTLLYRTRSL